MLTLTGVHNNINCEQCQAVATQRAHCRVYSELALVVSSQFLMHLQAYFHRKPTCSVQQCCRLYEEIQPERGHLL